MTEVSFGLFDICQNDRDLPTAQFWSEHLELARLADTLGLEYIFLAERHFLPVYRAATPALLLANLAATTTRARLGVMAWTLALHNPVLLAEQISALDHLSGGRLEVGAGLGHRPQEIAALGLPAEHRQAIFVESLLIMRRLWEGTPFNHDGALYHLRDVQVDPPLQQPHPPLWYAGNDPNIAGWARRNGLNLAVGFQPDVALRTPAEAFAGGEGKLAVMRHVYIAESDEAAHEEIIADLMRVGAELAANPRTAQHAPSGPVSRAEAERRYADMLAQQVLVAGGAATVATEIVRSLTALNATVFLANVHLTGVEDARLRTTLARFAQDVAPAVRAALAG